MKRYCKVTYNIIWIHMEINITNNRVDVDGYSRIKHTLNTDLRVITLTGD